jgi:hypothetical protein
VNEFVRMLLREARSSVLLVASCICLSWGLMTLAGIVSPVDSLYGRWMIGVSTLTCAIFTGIHARRIRRERELAEEAEECERITRVRERAVDNLLSELRKA